MEITETKGDRVINTCCELFKAVFVFRCRLMYIVQFSRRLLFRLLKEGKVKAGRLMRLLNKKPERGSFETQLPKGLDSTVGCRGDRNS